jgi:hypothetical protein
MSETGGGEGVEVVAMLPSSVTWGVERETIEVACDSSEGEEIVSVDAV